MVVGSTSSSSVKVLKVSSVNSASNSSGVLGSVTPPKSVRWLHLVGGKRVREWQVSNR